MDTIKFYRPHGKIAKYRPYPRFVQNFHKAGHVDRARKMQAMREDGMTQQEIGDVFGVCRERVRQILKRRKREMQ